MKLKRFLGALHVCAALVATTSANAALVRFTVVGDYVASWDLDSSPSASDYRNGTGFVLWNVAGSFTGATQPKADLTFFNAAASGGLSIYDFEGSRSLLATDGPQLYTGPESAPSFKLGTFVLSEFGGTGTYSLTIAELSSVPEPTSAALAAAGLCLLYVSRRSRVSTERRAGSVRWV